MDFNRRSMQAAMKYPIAFLFALLVITQAKPQAEKAEAQVADVEFKTMTLPVVNMTEAEVKAYNNDPKNKPKLDSKPTGKKEKQPSTAGTSYLKTSGQIIGGSAAAQKQFPWQVVLIANNAWLCGGSLISTTVVLTAAHCIWNNGSPVSFSITAGGINRNTAETGEVTKTTSTSIYHSGYNPNTLVNDIGVIKFSTAWVFNTYINAIRMPKTSQASTTFAGKSAVVSGYGKTSNSAPGASVTLNWVTLSVITNSACAQVYGSTTIISSSICTAAGAKSTCSGDSGGPLVFKEADGKFTQIGVVSFGAAASCNNYPNGYARVTSFLGWISNNTGIILP